MATIGSRNSSDFQNLHRNKRSLTLNLKDPEGIAILKRLAERADVLVENYRPDVKHRLGIDYETLRAVNPRLVYASISGFGQDGPYRERPGFDQIAQGMGGLMSITGLPGQGPVRAGIAIADLTAGVFCAMGILLALLEREESGEGQWVQSSLLAAQIAMLDFQAARWLISARCPEQAGNNHPTSIPTGVFATADGHINIAASGGEIFARLCKALGAEQLATDPDFANGKGPLAQSRSAQRRDRGDHADANVGRMDRHAEPRGRSLRPDLSHRRSLRRSAGAAHGYCACDRVAAARPAGRSSARPSNLSRTPWTLRTSTPERASIRMRSCPRSATPRQRSRASAPGALSEWHARRGVPPARLTLPTTRLIG